MSCFEIGGLPRKGGRFGLPLAAFTILELLTAMAVLAMILVMLIQVVNGILQSTRSQSQQMDSVGTARRILDVIDADLALSVVDENAAVLAHDNTSGLAFLTARRGPVGTAVDHRFLAVTYAATNGRLTRSYGSVDFSSENLLIAATNVSTSSVLAEGILAFQVRVVTDSGNYVSTVSSGAPWSTNIYNSYASPADWKALITRSPDFSSGFTNRVRALTIWVAAVDDQNRELLKNTAQFEQTQAALGDDPTAWRSQLDALPIPSPAKSGIRILTKTIPLR